MNLFDLFAKGRRFLVRKVRCLAAWDWREWCLGWRSCRKFTRLKVSGKTVLIVEPNSYHAELLPGFVNYFQKIGIKTVLLCRREHQQSGVFSRVPAKERPLMFVMNPALMKCCLKPEWTCNFEYVFLTSSYLAERYGFFGLFFNYLGFDPIGKKSTFIVEHVLKNIQPEIEAHRFNYRQIFALNEFSSNQGLLKMLNPHYFGEVRIQRRKTEPIVFITVGAVFQRGRNAFDELIQAVQQLEQKGYSNFLIKVIGRGMDKIFFGKTGISRICPLGCLDYPQMFSKLEEAHYFLPLLDPNLENHREYLTDRTSGSRQLILGFAKIPIIHEAFASVYGFNEINAVLYTNGGLETALERAINMEEHQYFQKVEALEELKNEIYSKSMTNLLSAMDIVSLASNSQ